MILGKHNTTPWRNSRPVFYNPEKPSGAAERAESPAESVKINRLLNEYERKRQDLLGVIGDFKKKDDAELRLKAMQYENKVLNETMDPSVLRALRGLTEAQVNGYIAKLREIADTTVKRDETLAAWLEGREKEKEERERLKIEQLVERYNYMREVNLAMIQDLRNYLGNDVLYEEMEDKLANGFPPLSPENIEDRKGIQAVIGELAQTMAKYKPQIDEARAFRHEFYAKAFYHAVGRAHDRFLPLLESNPAEFEREVAEMINKITQMDLKKAEAGGRWTVTYKGLTFTVNRGGRGMYASLTGASEENLKRYAKLGEFLERPRRGHKRTAEQTPPAKRRTETEL